MLRLYDYRESGNAYKVRLLLSQLKQPFERVHLDILQGETRGPAFLAKNPNQRVPLVEWPDGRRLAENPYFVAGRYSIADIALYSYTHVAEEGGFELERFPHVRAWLARVASEAGHVRIGDEVGERVAWTPGG